MRRLVVRSSALLAVFLVACSDADDGGGGPPATSPEIDAGVLADAATTVDASPKDAAAPPDADAADAAHDGAANACSSPAGESGQCMTMSACAAITDRTSTTGHCAKTGDICCVKTPSTLDDPPIPTGYKLMVQADVTAEMTTWAVAILHDPVTYPMYATALKTFGTLMVLARVEWHPPDFQNSVIHRGVTLYEPI